MYRNFDDVKIKDVKLAQFFKKSFAQKKMHKWSLTFSILIFHIVQAKFFDKSAPISVLIIFFFLSNAKSSMKK